MLARTSIMLVPLLAQTAPTPSPSPSAVGAKVQKFYDLVTTLEADFDQDTQLKAYGTTKTAKGHVTFEKPGKMRWEYSAPHKNLVVSDGKTIWHYDESTKTACKLPATAAIPSAFGFLTGKGDLTKDFTLSFAKVSMTNGHVLDATPKTPTNAVAHMLLYVDAATTHVRKLTIVDGQANTNAFVLTNMTANGKIPATRFSYVPGPGVIVKSAC